MTPPQDPGSGTGEHVSLHVSKILVKNATLDFNSRQSQSGAILYNNWPIPVKVGQVTADEETPEAVAGSRGPRRQDTSWGKWEERERGHQQTASDT